MPIPHDDAWGRHLLNGERLLWSGRPPRGIVLTARDQFLIPFSLVWCSFAVFWTLSVLRAGGPVFFRLWGTMFIGIGIYLVAGRMFIDAWLRRKTRYAVTDRRILIVRSGLFGRTIAIDIAQVGQLELGVRRGGAGTVRFGGASAGTNRGLGFWSPALDPTPQFIAIPDARALFVRIETLRAKL